MSAYANPDVLELYEYNAGRQWTHLADSKSRFWHQRESACGRWYANRRSLITSDIADVDCPSCLRIAAPPETEKP
jgi:hypothetical protein